MSNVRFPFLHKAAYDLRLMRLFGVRGSKGARALVGEDYREYKSAAKRGHRIRKAQRRRQRGR